MKQYLFYKLLLLLISYLILCYIKHLHINTFYVVNTTTNKKIYFFITSEEERGNLYIKKTNIKCTVSISFA